MGRETKNFRQTNRAGSADHSASTYGRIQRQGSWGKLFSAFHKVRGKIYGKS